MHFPHKLPPLLQRVVFARGSTLPAAAREVTFRSAIIPVCPMTPSNSVADVRDGLYLVADDEPEVLESIRGMLRVRTLENQPRGSWAKFCMKYLVSQPLMFNQPQGAPNQPTQDGCQGSKFGDPLAVGDTRDLSGAAQGGHRPKFYLKGSTSVRPLEHQARFQRLD